MATKKSPRGGARFALARWMKRKESPTSARRLAELLEVNPVNVYAWLNGSKRPSLEHAVEIERLSGIAPKGWVRR